MQIELHPEVAKNLLEYLLNAKKRAEFVISKKERYDKAAVERAERVVALLSVVCNALDSALKKEVKSEEKPKECEAIKNLEKRVKDLELKLEQAEVIIKKLAAYHSGEIK